MYLYFQTWELVFFILAFRAVHLDSATAIFLCVLKTMIAPLNPSNHPSSLIHLTLYLSNANVRVTDLKFNSFCL